MMGYLTGAVSGIKDPDSMAKKFDIIASGLTSVGVLFEMMDKGNIINLFIENIRGYMHQWMLKLTKKLKQNSDAILMIKEVKCMHQLLEQM